MFRKILLYGFPVYLYLLELFLKTLASVATDSLAGPTLAGAGIGFLFPLTELKQLQIDKTLADSLKAANARAFSPKDKTFSDFVWVVLFLALAGWMYSLFLTMRPSPLHTAVNRPLIVGCVTFVVSIVLTEVKERI